jgi:GNAT superfamily N-acetyltransferase
MTPAEFDAYIASAVPAYADDLLRNTAIPWAEADRLARRTLEDVLPHGRETSDHRFLVATDEATGDRVGILWLAVQRRAGAPVLWIYDIVVDEPLRGHGYGRALMTQVEELAVADGILRIELNVFGDNPRARALYASLGYTEMSRQMYKALA